MSYYKRVHINNKYKIDPVLADHMFETWLLDNNIRFEKFKIIDLHTIDVWFLAEEDYFLYQLHR